MPPLLTVGVPVYNGMPFVKETMESLMNQTFKDFKILVINDGSTDDSLEYLRSLNDPRLKLISQENCGLTGTLNRMLAEVDTPWLVRQDADDISLPDRMGMLNNWAMRHPDAGLLYSHVAHYQNNRLLFELQTTVGSPGQLRRLTKAGHLLSICHSAVAINARKLINIGGYRFDLYVEDYDMYWRMALATDLLYIPKILVGARIGSKGISGTNIEKQALNMLWIQYLLISENSGLTPLDYPEAAKRLKSLLSPGVIQYRLQMRRCLDCVCDRRYPDAAAHLLYGAISSPDLFAQRVLKFLRADKNTVLGISPAIFKRRQNDLWPGAVATANRTLGAEGCPVGDAAHH